MATEMTGRVGGGLRRMIGLLGVTTLVLVAGPPRVLPAAAEGTNLKPPYNVNISITDDTFILQWNSSRGPGGNVTFSADYQTSEMNNWMKLPGCQYIASTSCDFSSLDISVYDKIKLRIRAEEGNSTSPWYELDSFTPYQEARIGPPKVRLEAEDTAITVNISPPGTRDDGMWSLDRSNFKYSIVFWKNTSGLQKTRETAYPRYTINNLSPETTYCLKVKARLALQGRAAVDSPVHCATTTVENTDTLPPPENIQVSGRNQDYVLQWSYAYENVTFQSQWLYAFFKKTLEDYEANWTEVPNCDKVRTTQCVFPRSSFLKGIYFFRVRACGGNSTSPWSGEKEFDTESQAIIPPPIMTVKAVGNNSLRVFISSQDKSANWHYPLTYEIIFWENTSNAERRIIEKRTDFTISNLKVLTVYCVRARSRGTDNSSEFGETVCERTQPGSSPSTWLVAVVCAVVVVPLVLFALRSLSRVIKYVFFPDGAPPSTISEYVSEQSLKNVLLFTSEEQTERCFIIENIDTITTVEETNQTDEDHKTYNSQTSQDSGNYSNEDESSGGKASGGPRQEDSLWRE